jgi:hypothetical protein
MCQSYPLYTQHTKENNFCIEKCKDRVEIFRDLVPTILFSTQRQYKRCHLTALTTVPGRLIVIFGVGF